MKKVLTVLMTLVMVFAMTACGGSADAPAEDAAMITVEIEIDYPDETGVADAEEVVVEVPEGSAVLDVLNAFAEANGCEIVMDENATPPYVIGIGGVEATDTAGWVYEVNDEMVMESADECVVNAGDEISWSFETWM